MGKVSYAPIHYLNGFAEIYLRAKIDPASQCDFEHTFASTWTLLVKRSDEKTGYLSV